MPRLRSGSSSFARLCSVPLYALLSSVLCAPCVLSLCSLLNDSSLVRLCFSFSVSSSPTLLSHTLETRLARASCATQDARESRGRAASVSHSGVRLSWQISRASANLFSSALLTQSTRPVYTQLLLSPCAHVSKTSTKGEEVEVEASSRRLLELANA